MLAYIYHTWILWDLFIPVDCWSFEPSLSGLPLVPVHLALWSVVPSFVLHDAWPFGGAGAASAPLSGWPVLFVRFSFVWGWLRFRVLVGGSWWSRFAQKSKHSAVTGHILWQAIGSVPWYLLVFTPDLHLHQSYTGKLNPSPQEVYDLDTTSNKCNKWHTHTINAPFCMLICPLAHLNHQAISWSLTWEWLKIVSYI